MHCNFYVWLGKERVHNQQLNNLHNGITNHKIEDRSNGYKFSKEAENSKDHIKIEEKVEILNKVYIYYLKNFKTPKTPSFLHVYYFSTVLFYCILKKLKMDCTKSYEPVY